MTWGLRTKPKTTNFRLFRESRVLFLRKWTGFPLLELRNQDPGRGKTMSTSLLYHAFGLVGYRQLSQRFQGGHVIFRIEQPRERHRCSACGSTEVWDQGGVERTFRTVPIGR